MGEKKCYAIDIVGRDISPVWVSNCKERREKHLCCRDCSAVNSCPYRCCFYTIECFFYVTDEDRAKTKLAYFLDRNYILNELWHKAVG